MSRLKRLCILPMAVFVVFSFSAPDVDARRGDRIERRGPSKSGRMKLRDRKERRDRHERLSNRRERWERVSDRRERRERWESRERWADRRHERHERRKTARHFAIGATIAAAALRSLTCQERGPSKYDSSSAHFRVSLGGLPTEVDP